SIHSLARSDEADEKIDGDRQFRIGSGYDRVMEALVRRLDRGRTHIALNSVVVRLRWQHQRVLITVLSKAGQRVLEARAALITLPLGVLQASPPARGAVEFIPALPQKARVAKQIAMGAAIRVVLVFRRQFWEEA